MKRLLSLVLALSVLSPTGSSAQIAIGAGISLGGVPIFNVKSYGAKCDGSTDDTTAIAAAYTAATAGPINGIVYFPPSSGACKFTTLTIPAGTGSQG
jgi:Pectate lyase superfamily protein